MRTQEDYYNESRRLRAETLLIADTLRYNPLHFTITNGITMNVEVTKSDLKTIVSKNTQDNHFNAFKNKIAQDIKGFLEKAQYEGWRDVVPLCVRKIKNTGIFKPYAIIDQAMFDAEVFELKKEEPLG